MFNNILIIGCGLIGSSILKASIQKKISKNFLYLKSLKNIDLLLKNLTKKLNF